MSSPTLAVVTALTAPRIKVNGTELSAQIVDRITALKLDLGLNMTGRGTMRFDDAAYLVSSDTRFAVGTAVEISAGTASLFQGQITGVELVHHRGLVDFVVTFDDPSYKMGLGNQVRTFLAQTASEVVSSIVGEYGMQVSVTSTTGQLPYLIQAGSDLELLGALAEQTGFDWWVSDTTLHFNEPTDAAAVATLTLDDDLLEFTVRATAIHPGTTTVSGWATNGKRQLSGTAARTTAPLQPTSTLVNGFVTASELATQNSLLDASRSPATQGEAQSMANSFAQRWVSQAATARGLVAVNPAITVGSKVTISGAGPSSGSYYLTEVQHSYSAAGFTTRFVAGDRRPARLVDSLGGARRSPQLGLMIGVVTQVNVANDNPGSVVKLKFPALSDQVESNWARIATVGGGPGRGVTFVPEVNDEVLVGFEQGDFTRPVVLGGLFNSADTMIDAGVVDGAVNRRRITSRTGHSIEMGDGTANADLYISLALAGGQHIVKMSKESLAVTVPANLPVSIKAGTTGITFDNQGNITIEGKKITIKATTDIELSGANITNKAAVKAETSATQLAMKATATAEVSASGMTTIKGAMVAIN